MKIYRYFQRAAILALLLTSCSKEPSISYGFFTTSFEGNDGELQEVSLGTSSRGSWELKNGQLNLTGVEDGYYGVYFNQIISGHFVVDLEIEQDKNIGLALIQAKNGKPDPDNYTILTVDQSDGNVILAVKDRQNGNPNVLDYTGKTDFDREPREEEGIKLGVDLYEHVLTGDQYSVPFKGTNGTIRIFREANGEMFHYYYQVKKAYEGEDYVDWMELRPSPDWIGLDAEFFVSVVALNEGSAVAERVVSTGKPMEDRKDQKTGFQVTEREYNWSGFMGDAYVVTFDQSFDYHQEDIKFVFWTEMNYIPAWHLNNQLLYTYEFVETWDENVAGCHEPMSDRVRQWTWVRVLEDNAVRKVLQWHYVLANPDYKVPADGKGEQLPEVDEFWTFYPDGSGVRHIRYTPKLDTDFRAAHELGEMISIAGSKSHSEEFYDSPALTLMNLDGDKKQAHPGPKFDYYSPTDDWSQQVIAVHFKEGPDVFSAWSVDKAIPETYSGYKIRYENAWQNPNGKIVHWPVNKRPYTSAFAAGGTWKSEVSHACLLSFGVRDGIDWTDHYEVDDRGRKYREWASLVGLNEKGEEDKMLVKTRSWLDDAVVLEDPKSLYFEGKDYMKNTYVFEVLADPDSYSFTLGTDQAVINPAFQFRHWGKPPKVQVLLDGKPLPPAKFKVAQIDHDMLIWIEGELTPQTVVTIKRNEK